MSSRGEPPPDPYPYAVVGRHLRKAREQLELNRVQLARRADIDQSLYSKYELGRRLPTVADQPKLERVFGWRTGHILRLAGLVEETETLEDMLAGRPGLTADDVEVIMGLVGYLEGKNVLPDR